tara:strand:+ start:1809 stop:2888 length:1080 start_codon:yes stop_codon:yes gene_type:complete
MAISKITGVEWDNIVKASGIAKASVAKAGGVDAPADATHSPLWVVVGSNKLAYSTDQDAATWTEVTTNAAAFKDLTFGKNSNGVDAWYGCSTSDANGFAYSTDVTVADSWTTVNPPGSGGGTAIEYGELSSSLVMGREHENYTIRRSTDYGINWTDSTIQTGAGNSKATDSLATDGNGIWVAGMGSLGIVLKSFDDGINWYKSKDLGSDKHLGVEYANGVWVATEEGETINICTDVGADTNEDTWTQISPPTWQRPADAITHVSGNTWMLGATRRNMYKSVDNGANWTAVTSLTNHAATSAQTNNNAYSMASDGTNVVATGRNGYINVSTDLGSTWRTAHTMSSNTHTVAVEYNKIKPF